MISYLFFPTADKAQDRIWQYSCKVWGEQQAIKYIKGMHRHLQLLSEKKKAWRIAASHLVVPADLSMEVYFSKYKYHYLFFRKLADEKIGILAILHEKSDIPVRLCDDLRRLEGQ